MRLKNQAFFKNWENTTAVLTAVFRIRYFGRSAGGYWIANEIGSVYVINDHFFNLDSIADFLRYEYTRKDMFAYYEYSLRCNEKNISPINIKAWRKFKNK